MSAASTPARTKPAAGERRPRGLLWVAAGASLWGTDAVLRRPLTEVWSSPQIVLLEHLALAAILLPVLWRGRREWRRLSAAGWCAVLAISWGGSALATMLFTQAIKTGNPTSAILLQKMQPLCAAVLARWLLGERLRRRFWALLLVALGGAYLVSFGLTAPARPQAAPALLALGAAALWGGSTVLGRFALRTVSWPVMTALRIVLAAPLLAALAGIPPAPPDGGSAAGLVALALVPGLSALLLYYRGLGSTRASYAAVAELAFPATAALLNWMILGAEVSAAQAAGFALVWFAIFDLEERRHE